MGTRRFPAYAATIGTVILFALSGASQAFAEQGGNGGGGGGDNNDEHAATVCDGTLTVTSTTIACTIDQTTVTPPGSESQNNTARCIERSSAPDMVEICTIMQTNDMGSNRAIVVQEIRQNDGPIQLGRQRTTITQTNDQGSNAAAVDQNLSQSTDGAGAQSQESDQGFRGTFDPGVTIEQQNNTGANLIGLEQSAKQTEKTHDATVIQEQVARQSSHLDQHHTPVDAGLTRAAINQDVDQKQHGPTPANQFQVADPHCCNFFEGSSVRVNLRQEVSQRAMMGAQQSATNQAHCIVTPATAGTCNVVETINQNGATITTTCSNSVCDIGQQCTDHTCAPCPTSEGTICPQPPPIPCISNCGAPILGGTSPSARLVPAASVRTIRAMRPLRLQTT